MVQGVTANTTILLDKKTVRRTSETIYIFHLTNADLIQRRGSMLTMWRLQTQRRLKTHEGRRVPRHTKKLWVLHILPYAGRVHWTEDLMHCFFNIIKDGLNSMRPTNSGDKKFYQNQNRTTATVVVAACLEEGNAILWRFMSFYAYIIGIHEHLGESTNAPWIFTKKECIESDDYMRLVIGPYTYEDCPQGVMKAGKADNSHDTIFWATVYARRWCFRSKGGPVYVHRKPLGDI
jgi:hypothetical protein